MFLTADQVLAHMVGDYVLQSDYMAAEKTKKSLAALIHAVSYALPFLFFRPSWEALAVIVVTHFVIDRWRLARYVCWIKNLVGPPKTWRSWEECKGTGYAPERPPFLSVWLMIITDNLMHVTLNALALTYL